MARNISGVYSLPAGSLISNGDVSDASDLNTPLSDIEADLNAARPIVAGGTGATTAADARTNLGVAIGTDVQAYDADLAAIAGLSSNGIVTRTGSGTAAARTITAGAGISVTNGDGVSGNPTVDFNRGAPVTKTADFTVAASENWLINNKSGSACVVTLPAASGATGREIMIQNLQAQAVNSASSNVIPLAGGSAAAAILPAIIGSRATLVSDGTSWRVVDFYMPPIGDGQTWQNVTGSRAYGTNYTNTTGRPIQVIVETLNSTSAAFGLLTPTVGGVALPAARSVNNQSSAYVSFIVPVGATYSVANSGTAMTLTNWSELR